MYLGICS